MGNQPCLSVPIHSSFPQGSSELWSDWSLCSTYPPPTPVLSLSNLDFGVASTLTPTAVSSFSSSAFLFLLSPHLTPSWPIPSPPFPVLPTSYSLSVTLSHFRAKPRMKMDAILLLTSIIHSESCANILSQANGSHKRAICSILGGDIKSII